MVGIASVRFSLRHYTLSKYRKNQEINFRALTMNSIVVVLTGKIACLINGSRRILTKGDTVTLSNSQRLSGVVLQTAQLAIADFVATETLSLPTLFHTDISSDFTILLNKLKDSWLQTDANHQLEATGLFLQMLAYLNGAGTETSSRYIRQIKQYINKHFNEKITIKKMAQDIGISRVYCGAVFKKEVGTTINNYINEVRIKEAATLLTHNDQASLTAIAKACGFKNLSYFSRLFKEYTNVAPSRYQQLISI